MVFMKPESALRRADELIDVGKKQRALETLFEVITSRRHRTWTKTHEPLMEKFLDLCVELKKSQIAKDGLHQYKTISQTVSVKSLEDVIMRFLKNGEQRCLDARKEATNALVDIDDLEVLQSPESLLLSAVSGESQQDRTDRDMLAPWLKFVWESYKQCLDLLKNNNRVEKIYQEVAQMGFRFCQQYNRRPEFRKLCDTIRTHFVQSQKYSQQMYSVNFQLPETQALHLETRLVQLDTAIAMELWQEAFKAVEDIHAFTTISKKTPRPQQLASYYNKVALVFWKAGNYVFHATTVLKLYVLHKEQKKNITHAELSRLSTKALLAILSIPLPTPRTQIDEHLETEETTNEKQKRLTGLLSLQQIPTRASLIRDMIKQGVLNFVYPELKNMYEWLEVEFNPLKLSKKMEDSIQFVEKLSQPEYTQYMPALRDVTVVRLLQQISQVYQTIELKRFIDLAPSIDKHRLEKIIVNAAKNNDVQVRIEHKLKALTFGTDLNLSSNGQTIESQSAPKTNVIQKMPNEQIRNQLISISRALYSSMEIISEKSNKERNDKLRREIALTYSRDEINQRKEILKRRELIERYKEDKEIESKNKLRQLETTSRHQEEVRVKEEEERRKADQARRKAEAALEREKEEHRLNMKIAIDKLRESDIGRRIIELIGEEELYKYDPESLNSLHIDAVIKHSREQKEKLKVQFKKVDFFARALHDAEVPLVKKYNDDETNRRRDIQLQERELAIERRGRLVRMDDDKNDFLNSIRGQRHEDFLTEKKEFEQRLTIARQQRLEQIRKEHVEKKKQDWKKQKENKKQEKIQSKLKRQEAERIAALRASAKARDEKLAEQLAKQREREAAVEAKLKAEQDATRSTSTSTGRRPAPSSDKDKTDSQAWRPTPRRQDDNQQSRVESKDSWRSRNDDQRLRNTDQRSDEPSTNKSASSNDTWKPRPRPEQPNRDERRDDRRDERRGPPSSSQQQQRQASPSSSDRWTERNSETSSSWRTVEKKRPNPTRTDNERPSQQRSGESSSSGAWRPKQRPVEEPRENIRSGPPPADSWGRADANSSWRSREKKRLNSWRANDSDDENERPSSDNTRGIGGSGNRE
ncbi:unnamed protein product [Adineta steineri]|uniref:Eukaryotic translation initiation factor 3 subunit A n=1 Tax=Adineta steineri TaxID=433720 RepID=A0A814WSF8_9BILA|nr:unnamed protein product [Adineta steineri]CAF1557061.1 unnamed protein product [Adineta steineri]